MGHHNRLFRYIAAATTTTTKIATTSAATTTELRSLPKNEMGIKVRMVCQIFGVRLREVELLIRSYLLRCRMEFWG